MTNVTILFIAVVIIIAAVIIIVGEIKETKRDTNLKIKFLIDERKERAKEAWREIQSKEIISQWNDLGFVGDLIYEGHDMYYISSEYGDKWMKIDRKEVHALTSYLNTFQS